MLSKRDDLLIVPIGGLEQVGANSTMIGYNKEWIVLDLGISFHDKYGIEVLIPDISFPMKVKNHIKGLFVTHAHEDHIGAIPYLWKQLRCPIYVTEFPAAVLEQKLSEYDWKDEVQMNIVKVNEPVRIGSFEIEYIPLSHSILGACGLYVKTKTSRVFYTGDWKIDETPLLGDKIDIKRMEQIGKEGVDILLCDSTNVLSDENSGSETGVRDALKKVFDEHKDKRLTITCFASNLARMETILNLSRGAGRKIAVVGRSMHKMISAISKTTYFSKDFKAGVSSMISEEEAVDMPANKVVFICTGSQGESRSALYRIARGENKNIKFSRKDIVIFSSRIIPGNDIGVRTLQNLIVKSGAELVTTDTNQGIHVSGHPNKSALEQMYKWLTPKALIPIHGDPYMLYAHEKFAKEKGIKETIIMESGDVVTLKDKRLEKIDHIEVGMKCIDGNDIIDLTGTIVKERAVMSCNGHIGVSFILNSNDCLSTSPDVCISGIHVNGDMQKRLQTLIYQVISNEISKHAENVNNLKENVKKSIKHLIGRHFAKKPIVSVHIHRC